MPLRFRRSIKLAPGIRWNIGSRGSSWTFGGHGYRTTVGHGHVRRTFGLPGTGISYTTSSRSRACCCPLALFALPFFAVQAALRAGAPDQASQASRLPPDR